MHIGIAADYGGFELKAQLSAALKTVGYEVTAFGAHKLVTGDVRPDFVVSPAWTVAKGQVTRGLHVALATNNAELVCTIGPAADSPEILRQNAECRDEYT